MVSLQTKNSTLDIFWMTLEWKISGIFYGHSVFLKLFVKLFCRLVYFMAIWYIFYQFGVLYQEKSGNPGSTTIFQKQQVSDF
jgi:hypothetical protein